MAPLETGAGEYRVLGMILPLDRVVDGADGAARPHVDGGHSVVEGQSGRLQRGDLLATVRRLKRP